MKKIVNILLLIIFVSGCGSSELDRWIKEHNDPCDIGLIDCDNDEDIKNDNNATNDDNATNDNTTNDNTTNDDNVTNDNTTNDDNATNDNNTISDNKSDDNITSDDNETIEDINTTNSEIEIDPNACSSDYLAIEDKSNDPQGKSANGITFTNFLSDPNTVLIFYYKKTNTLNNETINFDKFFNDKDKNVNFMLSIDSSYVGKGYFYIKNSSNNRCFRGEFPKDQFSTPNYTLVEVIDK